jgi:hypothetical protein
VEPFAKEDIQVVVVKKYNKGDGFVYDDELELFDKKADAKIPFNAGGYVAGSATDCVGNVAVLLGFKENVPDLELTNAVFSSMKVKITGKAIGAATINVSNMKSGKNVVVKGSLKDTGYNVVANKLTAAVKEVGEGEEAVKYPHVYAAGDLVQKKGVAPDQKAVEKNWVLYEKSAAKGVDAAGNYKVVKMKVNKQYAVKDFKALSVSGESIVKFAGVTFFDDKDVLETKPIVAAEKYTAGKFTFETDKKEYAPTGEAIYPSVKVTSKKDGKTVYLVYTNEDGKGGTTAPYGYYMCDNVSGNRVSENGIKALGFDLEGSVENNFYVGTGTVNVFFIPQAAGYKYTGYKPVKFKIKKAGK